MITPPETVARMAEMYAAGHSLATIGKRYGMTAPGVLYHLRNVIPRRSKAGGCQRRHAMSARTQTRLKRIRYMAENGYTPADMAEELGVGIHTIYYLRHTYLKATTST